MGCRHLVFTSLLVGLTVAPPPGGPHHGPPSGPPPGGPHHGSLPPPGGTRPGSGGPGDSYDYGMSPSEIGAPSGSLNEEMKISGQPNQPYEQQFAYGFPTEGPKQGAQPQGNNLQGQGFYQGSFKPQDGLNSQQPLGIHAPDSQQSQAYLQQNPAFLQQSQAYLQQNPAFLQQSQAYQAYLQHQLGQKPYSSGFAQQIPLGASWGQSVQAQQDQQLGGFSGSFPGYGYSASPSFNGYMPQSTLGGGMGYIPGMYNPMPMVMAAPHDFTPFSTGYGMGAGGYGMPQVYGGQTYPQGSQGYAVGPASPSHGQMTPNDQGAQFYNTVSPLPTQTSNQKLPQSQINGKIQTPQ